MSSANIPNAASKSPREAASRYRCITCAADMAGASRSPRAPRKGGGGGPHGPGAGALWSGTCRRSISWATI